MRMAATDSLFSCVCKCVYACVYVCTCVCKFMCVYVLVCVHIYVCMHACMCVCVCTSVNVYMLLCEFVTAMYITLSFIHISGVIYFIYDKRQFNS